MEVAASCREVVLVCRKCSKKLDGGFGSDGTERLAKALRQRLGGTKGRVAKLRRRAVAVVEVGCLDICPKGAIVAVRGGDPSRWLLVPKGAALPEVERRLGLSSVDMS